MVAFRGLVDLTSILFFFFGFCYFVSFFFMGHSHLDSPAADVIFGLLTFGL